MDQTNGTLKDRAWKRQEEIHLSITGRKGGATIGDYAARSAHVLERDAASRATRKFVESIHKFDPPGMENDQGLFDAAMVAAESYDQALRAFMAIPPEIPATHS